MTKPTDYRGALDLIHEWVESEDDMLPEDLEPEALAWLIRKLGQERDAAEARLNTLINAAQCNISGVENLVDREAKEVLVNLCRMILESPNDD